MFRRICLILTFRKRRFVNIADIAHVAPEDRQSDKVAKWKAILGENKEPPPPVEEFLLDRLFSDGGRREKLAGRLDTIYADLRQEQLAFRKRAAVAYGIACAALVLGLFFLAIAICLSVLAAIGLASTLTLAGCGALFEAVAAAAYRVYLKADARQAEASRLLDDHCKLLQAFQIAHFLPTAKREAALQSIIHAYIRPRCA